MIQGLDANESCAASAHKLFAQGYRFVVRYLGHSTKKDPLTLHEAKVLSAAGLNVVSVYESGNPTVIEYFQQKAQGYLDATRAIASAQECGQPYGTPIYLAIDMDVDPDQLEQWIVPYFQSARESFYAHGPYESDKNYLVGVYGNGITCKRLKDLGLVHYTWVAQPLDWQGDKQYADSGNLHQLLKSVDSLNSDADTSNGDGGGWKVKS